MLYKGTETHRILCHRSSALAIHWKTNQYPVSMAHGLQHHRKPFSMKTFGIILIVVGIAMILIRGFSVQTEKKVVDVGPLQVNKKENRWIGWPTYAGAVIAVVGVIMVVSDKRRT